MSNTEPVSTIRLIAEIQLDHVVKSHGLNLGQYRSEYDCACGEKIYTDQHTSLHEAQACHIAAAIISQLQRICASEQTKAILDAETEMRLKFDARQHDFATFEWMIAQLNDYVGSLQTQLEGEIQ